MVRVSLEDFLGPERHCKSVEQISLDAATLQKEASTDPVITSTALAPQTGLGRTGMLTNWKERVSLQRKLWKGSVCPDILWELGF